MKISIYKPTNDDWYGCYEISKFSEIKLVTVMFTQTGPDPKNGKGDWRVCVWGTDDCGMEKTSKMKLKH